MVFAVCVAIVLIRAYMRSTQREAVPFDDVGIDAGTDLSGQGAAAQDDDSHPQPPAFLRRLEADIGSELSYVSADDHYLQVVTAQGQGRILFRFRDALEDLAEVPGYRIHRSHWVAQAALIEVRQSNRRHYAILRDGTELPISKAHLEQLRADGWLD